MKNCSNSTERIMTMKRTIEDNWKGQFLFDGKLRASLKEWQPKPGEQFKIRLLAPRRAEGRTEKK